MSLQRWLDDRSLRPHEPSEKEMTDLLRVVDRDLRDASLPGLSADRRFVTAYNAALTLATIVVRASGYRTAGPGHHWLTIRVLPLLLGSNEQERADYFDSCRRKRNLADYDVAGQVSEAEVGELLDEARSFRTSVLDWLAEEHPGLKPRF